MNIQRVSKAIAAGVGAAVTAFGTAQTGATPPPVWAQIALAVAAGVITGAVTWRIPNKAAS